MTATPPAAVDISDGGAKKLLVERSNAEQKLKHLQGSFLLYIDCGIITSVLSF